MGLLNVCMCVYCGGLFVCTPFMIFFFLYILYIFFGIFAFIEQDSQGETGSDRGGERATGCLCMH